MIQFNRIGLSFGSGQALRDRLSMLPSVPKWKACEVNLGLSYPTTTPATLYFRDGMECLKHLFSNPVLGAHMDFQTRLVFRDSNASVHIYNEMMTGNWATETQVIFLLNHFRHTRG